MTFRFDAQAHRYYLGSFELPSVTYILKDVGLIETSFYTAHGMDRGTKAHRAAELLDLGTLDRESIDPEVAPRLAAYEKFLSEVPTAWEDIERPLYHEALNFAGTPDRIGLVNDRPAVLDIKCGPPQPWHGSQLSAYAMMAKKIGLLRYGLHLGADGNYKLVRYQDRSDEAIFSAALTVFKAKRRST